MFLSSIVSIFWGVGTVLLPRQNFLKKDTLHNVRTVPLVAAPDESKLRGFSPITAASLTDASMSGTSILLGVRTRGMALRGHSGKWGKGRLAELVWSSPGISQT